MKGGKGQSRERSPVIYFDNNATTAVDERVLAAMLPYLTERYGNPSSIHTFGGSVAQAVETARGQVAALLGAQPAEITFTSCGTESCNAAIFSAVNNCPKRRKVVISKVEHPAVLNVGKELLRRGYHVAEVPVDDHGRLDLGRLRELVDDNTVVVSVMWANNETGNVHPVAEIAAIAHAHGALFHTDAVQVVGKAPVDLAAADIDLLGLSGHKFHAPKGIGALYVRRGVRFHPYLHGGHQERGRRGGTEAVPLIVGLGQAAELAGQHLPEETTRVGALRDRLERELLRRVPQVRVNGDSEHRLPNTTNLSFEFIEGESILLLLDQLGVCASSGSACTTGSLEPSHVLRAMGVPYTAAHGSIRFSLSRFNTEAEVDFVIRELPPIIARLREISPYWRDKGAKR